MNGRCGFVGKSHPSHPFTTPHPTVYETSQTSPKKFRRMKFQQMTNECLQDEAIDCSSSYMRAFVWEFEGFGRGRSSIPSVGIISPTNPFNEELSLKNFILDS
jgi:hypothetical protein